MDIIRYNNVHNAMCQVNIIRYYNNVHNVSHVSSGQSKLIRYYNHVQNAKCQVKPRYNNIPKAMYRVGE